MQDPIKVLFLCTGNSCRSQMAEGWAKHLKSDQLQPWSAGIATHGLNKNAVRVMEEAGVDISHHDSKHVDTLQDIEFDYVITVCDNAAESCPVFPGNAKIIHQPFPDPPQMAAGAKSEEEALGHYRTVRDQIKKYVITLPGILQETKS